MMGDAATHVVLITGANKGIGFEAARQLARLWVQVILTARSPEKAEAAFNQLNEQGLHTDFCPMDVSQSTSVQNAVQVIQERYGRIDTLINNAGIYLDEDGSILSVAEETILKTFQTNTLGPIRVSQAFLPLLKQSKNGCIINVSSGYGSISTMDEGPAGYCISKAALNAVTRLFAHEAFPMGIRVYSVCPGWVRTDMGGPMATRSVEAGAKGIVDLAMLRDKPPTGSFLRDLQPVEW